MYHLSVANPFKEATSSSPRFRLSVASRWAVAGIISGHQVHQRGGSASQAVGRRCWLVGLATALHKCPAPIGTSALLPLPSINPPNPLPRRCPPPGRKRTSSGHLIAHKSIPTLVGLWHLDAFLLLHPTALKLERPACVPSNRSARLPPAFAIASICWASVH